MCVVAVAEELVSGAERPMDEEDAAAPVGGDRGRVPEASGLPGPQGRGPGRGLQAEGRGLTLCSTVSLGVYRRYPVT